MKHTCYLSIIYLFLIFSAFSSYAQTPKTYPAGELQLALKKLNTVGTALYVAAHPDDENTAMLSYLAKERLVRTAYLSITRGDGGQNLIGTEQAELLGVIRTQELLQARRTDGAEQYFTRAIDFGFSKSTDEAIQFWGREKVLADVVWMVRKLKPDVMLTRFPKTAQAGHGQHSASAVLAEEAFVAAADPKRFPEQLTYVQPWQAKRIVWNSYNPGFNNTAPEVNDFVSVNIGVYNPLLGKSYTEIAGESRSMHKSQGFGSARSRGVRIDYLRHMAGEQASQDLFDGIDLSWQRVPGGEAVGKTLQQAYETFKPENPSASLPLLLQAHQQLQQLPADNYWVGVKKEELENVITACAGLWFEANATTYAGTPSGEVKVNASVIKRSDFPVTLKHIRFIEGKKDTTFNSLLKNNELLTKSFNLTIPAQTPITQPYWLREKSTKGMYQVSDLHLIGKPEIPLAFAAEFSFILEGNTFTFTKPVNYKWTDPVEGELYRPFEIRPQVMVNVAENVYMFPGNQPKQIEVLLKAGTSNISGEVSLDLPNTWKVSPQTIPFQLKNNEEELKVSFQVTPPANASTEQLKAVVKTTSGQTLSKGIRTINYSHIPIQTLFPEAQAKLVRLDLQIAGRKIGYIMGAGDDIPLSLRQVGYQVTLLSENDLQQDVAYLSQFDAIIAGVRAYNTQDRLKFYQPKLLEYVKNGGTLLVQYNVSMGLSIQEIGPYPFRLSRNRVTVEESPVNLLKPQHPLLNTPNKIIKKDFEGWVQERGLYFADSLDTRYQTVISTQDPGKDEKPQPNGLFTTEYGKGRFVYTSYSFFRQLPAGVPGAYRLFANLIAKQEE